MAITINNEPSGTLFAYRPLLHEISSDATAIVRTIADVYVESTYVASLEANPDLDSTASFSFDIQGVVQDNLEHFDISTTSAVTNQNEINKAIQVKFFEVTQNADGSLATTWAEDGAGTGSTDSTGFQAVNGTLNHKEGNSLSNFLYSGAYGSLSKQVTPVRLKDGDVAIITGINTSTLPTSYRTRVKEYDSSDSLLANTVTHSVTASKYAFCAKYNTSLLNASTSYFTMRVESEIGLPYTDEIRFNLVTDCGNEFVSLYWFNSVGGWDYHLFEGKKTKQVKSKGTTFRQPLSTTFNSYERGNNFATIESSEVFEAFSRPQSNERMAHLSELVTHKTNTYILEDGEFIPVVITSSEMNVLDTYEGINQMKITFQYANNRISQRN